jgi:AcrR family transcriptional regulator
MSDVLAGGGAAEAAPLASRRERHKDERRARIVDAAYDLLREVGAGELSVKMIADRADVSAATIYNLFGAKGAVLEKVYARNFETFAARVAEAAGPSALDEAFVAIRVAADLYRSDPAFYRGMSLGNPRAEPDLVISVQGPRLAYWRVLLDRAVGERDLAAETRTDLIAMAMLQLGGGAFGAWCAALITVDELELQTAYGLARLLIGVAEPAARAKLQARIAELETNLAPKPRRVSAG